MKTSSISLAAAAVLTVASLNSAMAGGWIVSARPSFFPPMRMPAPPMIPWASRFGPMGQNIFHRNWRQFPPFSPFFPTGGAYFSAPSPYPALGAGEPLARAVIWAPINVMTVEPASRCAYGYPQYASVGGPKIITIGAPPRRDTKMPTVVYGTQGLRGC
jgi:hypothetical protein